MEKSLYVNPIGVSGCLALWWSKEVSITCNQISINIINSVVMVTEEGEPEFVSWIYGDPDFGRRVHNWNRLRVIGTNRRQTWICMGYFNDISNHCEKIGGSRKNQRKMEALLSMQEDLHLRDMGFKRQMHTWTNNRGGVDYIVERLDRMLANEAWSTTLPRAQCLNDLIIGSDHAPITLVLDHVESKGK